MRSLNSTRSRNPHRSFLVAVAVLLGASIAWAGEKPKLDLRSGRLEVMSVDASGSSRPHVLRENVTGASMVAAGGDASISSIFVSWQEGTAETWTAFSRNNGATWSTPQRLRRSLELRDGSVPPGEPMPVVDRRLAATPDQKVYFIALNTLSLPEWRAVLTARGAEVLSYFPHHAYLARIPASAVEGITALDFVDRVEPYHPAYRLEQSLQPYNQVRRRMTPTVAGLERLEVVLHQNLSAILNLPADWAVRLGLELARGASFFHSDVDPDELRRQVMTGVAVRF